MASLTIQAGDGSGSFGGYLALPNRTPAAAILVIQEIFGVNQVMRDLCDGFAAEGYVAFSPDLFWRIEPGVDITDKTEAEWQQAFGLMQKFDVDKGVEDLKAALAALRGHEAVAGKVGTVGYCLGGKLAFLMATRSDADCSVSYYGVGLAGHLGEASNIKRPLMLHVAREDGFVPKAEQDEVAAALKDNELVVHHSYAGRDHAFAREGGEHYDAEAAGTANQRTLAFFARHLRA